MLGVKNMGDKSVKATGRISMILEVNVKSSQIRFLSIVWRNDLE